MRQKICFGIVHPASLKNIIEISYDFITDIKKGITEGFLFEKNKRKFSISLLKRFCSNSKFDETQKYFSYNGTRVFAKY